VLLELGDGLNELVSNVSIGSAGSHSLEGEGVLGVVVSVAIPLGSGSIDVLSSLGERSELGKGLLVEQVSVGLQFLGRVQVGDLSQFSLGSSLDNSQNVLLQPSDDLDGLLVLLEGFNEVQVSNTSVLSERLSLSVNFVSSVINPS